MGNKFNFSFDTFKAYDNEGAHDAAKLIMRKGEQLSMKIFIGTDGIPSAWLESKTTDGFKYQLTSEGFSWLMKYLITGIDEDFGVKPSEVKPSTNEDADLNEGLLKQLAEAGRLKVVPLFRENPEYISAKSIFKKGTLFFRVKRTAELVEYLREKGLI